MTSRCAALSSWHAAGPSCECRGCCWLNTGAYEDNEGTWCFLLQNWWPDVQFFQVDLDMLRSMLKFDTTLKSSYPGKLLFVEGDINLANFVLKSSKAKYLPILKEAMQLSPTTASTPPSACCASTWLAMTNGSTIYEAKFKMKEFSVAGYSGFNHFGIETA